MAEEVINLDQPDKKAGAFSIFIVMLLVLLVLAGLGFGSGYLYGRVKSNEPSAVLEKSTKTTTDASGNKVFTDESAGYQITFDPKLTLSKRSDKVPGIKLTQDSNSLEFWVGIEEAVDLNGDQMASLKTKNFTDLEIAGQKAKMTEYVYKNGSYFSVVTLASTDDTLLVTFFLKASTSADYETLKKTAQTFKFI